MPSLPRFSNRKHKPHHFESHPSGSSTLEEVDGASAGCMSCGRSRTRPRARNQKHLSGFFSPSENPWPQQRADCLGDVLRRAGGGSGCWRVGRTDVCGRIETATRPGHLRGEAVGVAGSVTLDKSMTLEFAQVVAK